MKLEKNYTINLYIYIYIIIIKAKLSIYLFKSQKKTVAIDN